MESTLRIIEAIGAQWPFLIVLFIIIVIIINWRALGEFFYHVSDINLKKGNNEVSIKRKHNGSKSSYGSDLISDAKVLLINKSQSSDILLSKLKDSNTCNIDIITYTNEVEAGQINRYKVEGRKKIRIFKRSYISDRFEQQLTNIQRIKKNIDFRPWRKDKIILNTSNFINDEFENIEDVIIKQYFYDQFPRLRAYIFEDKEAVFSFYELSQEPNGSLYKGMNY